jgi:hypothetical protein
MTSIIIYSRIVVRWCSSILQSPKVAGKYLRGRVVLLVLCPHTDTERLFSLHVICHFIRLDYLSNRTNQSWFLSSMKKNPYWPLNPSSGTCGTRKQLFPPFVFVFLSTFQMSFVINWSRPYVIKLLISLNQIKPILAWMSWSWSCQWVICPLSQS